MTYRRGIKNIWQILRSIINFWHIFCCKKNTKSNFSVLIYRLYLISVSTREHWLQTANVHFGMPLQYLNGSMQQIINHRSVSGQSLICQTDRFKWWSFYITKLQPDRSLVIGHWSVSDQSVNGHRSIRQIVVWIGSRTVNRSKFVLGNVSLEFSGITLSEHAIPASLYCLGMVFTRTMQIEKWFKMKNANKIN